MIPSVKAMLSVNVVIKVSTISNIPILSIVGL